MKDPINLLRRQFFIKGLGIFLGLHLPKTGYGGTKGAETGFLPQALFTPKPPQTAALVWYSQTGHTQRAGQLIQSELEAKNIRVKALDYREWDPGELADADLIIAGSPVHYYQVPVNFRQWLENIPELAGIPSAAYVTFGGEGGNQYNTSVELLNLLTAKGGLPVGLAQFGNMSTFALTWSLGNTGRILRYRDKPDKASFDAIRKYAGDLVDQCAVGTTLALEKEWDSGEWIKGCPSIWGTRLMITRHRIDPDRCTGCGICVQTCPVNAIDLGTGNVDRDRCLICLGCVNNCPESAVDMAAMGKPVQGFNDFLKTHGIQIKDPYKPGSTG